MRLEAIHDGPLCIKSTYSMNVARFRTIGCRLRLWVVADHVTKRIAIPKIIPARLVDDLRVKAKEIMSGIIGRAADGGRVTLPIEPDAEELFVNWYNARPRSIFAKRLDTYGHRLMILLAVSDERDSIDVEVVRAVLSLLDWQFRVRLDTDPIDADNLIAGLEQKIKNILAAGPLPLKDIKRKSNYSRAGLGAFDTALKNLVAAKEVVFDKRQKPTD